MNVANSLATGGGLWRVHATFQDNKERAHPQEVLWDTDGDATDLDEAATAASRNDDTAMLQPSPFASNEDVSLEDESYHSALETDGDNTDGEDFCETMVSNLHLCTETSEFDLEPRLEYTQQLISSFVATGREKTKLSREKPAVLPTEHETEQFPVDTPVRIRKEDAEVEERFGVKLVSPAFFDEPAHEHRADTLHTPGKSTLASMIHPMSPDLFFTPAADYTRRYTSEDDSEPSVGVENDDSARKVASPGGNQRVQTNLFPAHEYREQPPLSSLNQHANSQGHSKLGRAFKSSARDATPICYKLSTGKKGMSREHKMKSKSYLPHDPLLGSSTPSKACTPLQLPAKYDVRESERHSTSDKPLLVLYPDSQTALSILLVDCKKKIFEIVAVEHVTSETTVGDVLSKARTQASDPRLSQQTYVSLCNSVNDLAAPMLPVNLIVNAGHTDDTGTETSFSLNEETAKKAEALDPTLGRLLMAVPEGSSPSEVRAIQRALWSHPRVQRWWKRENRFSGQRRKYSSKEK